MLERSRFIDEYKIRWFPINIIDIGDIVIKLIGDIDNMIDTGNDI